MSGPELKPCPFCGGQGVALTGPVQTLWGVTCLRCSCWLDDRAPTAIEAVAAWNRRTPDPAQIRADAIREAAALIHRIADGYAAGGDNAIACGLYLTEGNVLALLDTTLSSTAVDGSPAPDAGGNADPAVYLIRKYGGYYRPNCQGYTRFKEDAGRYTLAEAIRESHPNGPDGPRDGMTYIHEDDVGPFDAGGKEGV